MIDTSKRFEEELGALKQKYENMQMEIQMFKNIEGKKEELSDRSQDMEDKQKSLKSVMAVTVSAVEDAKKKLEQFEVCYCKICFICWLRKKNYSRTLLRKMTLTASL